MKKSFFILSLTGMLPTLITCSQTTSNLNPNAPEFYPKTASTYALVTQQQTVNNGEKAPAWRASEHSSNERNLEPFSDYPTSPHDRIYLSSLSPLATLSSRDPRAIFATKTSPTKINSKRTQ